MMNKEKNLGAQSTILQGTLEMKRKRNEEADGAGEDEAAGPSTSRAGAEETPARKKTAIIMQEDGTATDTQQAELMKVLHLGVIKTADDVRMKIKQTKGVDVEFDPKMQASLTALVRDVVVDKWAPDLAAFARHAKRQKITVNDVALLMRRNPALSEFVQKSANLTGKIEMEKVKKRPAKATGQRVRLSMKDIIAQATAVLGGEGGESDESDEGGGGGEKMEEERDQHGQVIIVRNFSRASKEDDSFNQTFDSSSRGTPDIAVPILPVTSTPFSVECPQLRTPHNGLNPVTPISTTANHLQAVRRPEIVRTIGQGQAASSNARKRSSHPLMKTTSIPEIEEEEEDNMEEEEEIRIDEDEDSLFGEEPTIISKKKPKSESPFLTQEVVEDSTDFDDYQIIRAPSTSSIVKETLFRHRSKESVQSEERQKEAEEEQINRGKAIKAETSPEATNEGGDDFDMTPVIVVKRRTSESEAVNAKAASEEKKDQVKSQKKEGWTNKFSDFTFDDDDGFFT